MLTKIIDDLSLPHPQTLRGTAWELLSDTVMCGVSAGQMTRHQVQGRTALRLQGAVRLDNDGGFLQLALDLAPGGGPVDASAWQGIAFAACGPAESYNLHLRTNAVTRPWQSYRASFTVQPDWAEVQIPFADLAPHRLEAPFDARNLRRIGLVAIGRAFQADLAVADIRFF